jgi:translation initiation factor 2 beta subunit (eIF-2beta)/eIF-5
MKLGTSVDGHEKKSPESFIEIAKEINGREPILSKICIIGNVQENMILHNKTFYFCKTCAKT